MDTPSPITVSRESAIMASGTSGSPWVGRPSLIASAMVGIVLLLAGIGIWAWAAPLPIPSDTVVLVDASPSAIKNMLPEPSMETLPLSWQTILSRPSDKKFIFGAYQRNTVWHAFIIVPRWSASIPGTFRENHGLYAALSDEPFPSERRTLSMLEPLGWGPALSGRWAKAWVNPQPFIDGSQPFTASIGKGLILTSLDLNPTALPPLKEADLSLNLTDRTANDSLAGQLANELPIGNRSLAEMDPQPVQIDFEAATTGEPMGTHMFFNNPISLEQAQKIYAAFGFTATRSVQLGDGTVVQEQTFVTAASGTGDLAPEENAAHQKIEWHGSEVDFGPTATSSAMAQAANCGLDTQQIRLSSQMLAKTIQEIGIVIGADLLKPIQIGSRQKHLAVCFE